MPEPGGRSSLWSNRNWRLLWFGQSVSYIGDMVFYVTVMLWIATEIAKGQPWAPVASSGALVATAAPVLLVGPLAGVFVDRWDRRRVMLTADAARFVLIISLLALPLLGHRLPVGAQLAILYVVLAVSSCFAEFFYPSRLAVLGAILPAEDQAKGSGLLMAAFSLAQIVGPALGAPLLFTFGVQWALILNGASFAFSYLCVRAIKAPEAEPDATARAGIAAELKSGIAFFARNRVLIGLAVGIVVAMLGDGGVSALAPYFVPHNLHVSASWLGVLISGVGVGAIAGAVLSGTAAGKFGAGRLFWISLIWSGVALIALSRVSALAAAVAIAALLGLGAGAINALSSPIILSVTPSRLLGRVSAVLSPLQQLAQLVSMVLAGVLASTALRGFHEQLAGVTFGPYDTVFAVGGLLWVAGGLAAIVLMRGAGAPAPATESVAAVEVAGSAPDAETLSAD